MTNAAERLRSIEWPSFPVDLGWRNLVFSVRLAGASLLALAIAYWLELDKPQWAMLTVYLLTQSSAGAALAKGVFRFIGTLAAAVCALVVVALFSQAPIPLVATACGWMFVCYYGATRASNFTAYAFMLAGYTGLLIIFEGAADPADAWRIAVDRASAISIGIACATLSGVLILPVYAGAQLRALMAKTLSELAHYAASALKPTMSAEVFISMRAAMLGKIAKFDALRSYTVFEARELRADDAMLRLAVREFLTVLAIARGLYFRLADFRSEQDEAVLGRLKAVLEDAAGQLEAIAADPHAFDDPLRVRSQLALARRRLAAFTGALEEMAGKAPLPTLANAALISRRATKILRAFSLVALTGQVAFSERTGGKRPRLRSVLSRNGEALRQGARAAIGLLAFCLFWYASGWDQGMAGITGFALMSYQCVNNDDPGKLGWPYFRASLLACLAAYLVMAFVYPMLEGFEMLAAFYLLVLIPLGVLIGTPRYASSIGTFTIYFLASATTANVYQPAPLDFANFCFGLILGMFVCLIAVRLMPVTSRASRRRAYRRTVNELLPEAAVGQRSERDIAREVIDLLATLLPRLTLGHGQDEIFLRGMLASASSAMELGRLRHMGTGGDLPEPARIAIREGLARFAAIFADLPDQASERETSLLDARNTISGMQAVLEDIDFSSGSATGRAVVDAASSLKFLSDRFELDRTFLDRSFAG